MAYKKRRPPVGARPGTLVLPEGALPPRIHEFRYDEGHVKEREVAKASDIGPAPDKGVLWVDVQGLGSEEILLALGERFALHALILEDIVHAPQRPKAEAYADHTLLITRMLSLDVEGNQEAEQVSVIVGHRWVLTFQEKHGDVLDPVRRRIRSGAGRIRKAGADYLAYAIVDTIVDGYFPVVEKWSETIERLEDEVLESATPKLLERLNDIKRDLIGLRRVMWPQREALNQLVRDASTLFTDETRLFLRDTYDHCIQLVEVTESQRELINGLQNTYLSMVSNRMNEVMKVLTIMASIFIPLTFLAGLYGMNLMNMPEMTFPWSYPILLCVMAVLAIGMVFFFRHKGWLGSSRKDRTPPSGH